MGKLYKKCFMCQGTGRDFTPSTKATSICVTCNGIGFIEAKLKQIRDRKFPSVTREEIEDALATPIFKNKDKSDTLARRVLCLLKSKGFEVVEKKEKP